MNKFKQIIISIQVFFILLLVFPTNLDVNNYSNSDIFDNQTEGDLSLPESSFNQYSQAFIGVSPDKKYINETLDVLNTSNPIYVYFDDGLITTNLYTLILSDLNEFFNYRYNTEVIQLDDGVALLENDIRNNSILIGNETVNDAVDWLITNTGFTAAGSPEEDGFDMQTYSIGTNSCVVVRGSDPSGDANGVYWMLDRCRTQEFGNVNFTAFRNPDLTFRMTSISIGIPYSYNTDSSKWATLNRSLDNVDGAIRRGANVMMIGGDYSFMGQYPKMCNYSWNTDIQSKLESSWNLTEIENRRVYVREVLSYIKSMGAEAYFWADQLHVLSPEIRAWLEETGDIDIQNERVKELMQGQLKEIFEVFPDVAGVMLRVGDDLYTYGDIENYNYGADIMYTPQTFRETTQALMEIVEEYDKRLVLRTWQMSVRDDCVHASPIAYEEAFGDLYWNEESLIICIKYTPNDYQRIPINPTLNMGSIKQIIEFQTINSFENYQYTPLVQVNTFSNALKNITTTTNGTENLMIGYFNGWGHETDLTTSEIEGPGAENNFRREGQFYFMQRSSWDTDVEVLEFCKDLAGKELGRESEIRDYFWNFYNLSDWAHWHLLYLPGHRENAPWLKSKWFHFTRNVKADPQAFGNIYYFCREDIDLVIDSVGTGLEYAYLMNETLHAIKGNVSEQNQIYLDYYINKAKKMVDFAELSYWYIRTAMHWWKYLETLSPSMLKSTFDDLPNLKSTLETYNSTYHYSYEDIRGHKEGLSELYGFVHWIETYNTNLVVGIIMGLMCIISLISTVILSKKSEDADIIKSVFSRKPWFQTVLDRERKSKDKLIWIAIANLIFIPVTSGILLSMTSFWQFTSVTMLYGITAIMGMEFVLFIHAYISMPKLTEKSGSKRENKAIDKIKNALIKTGILSFLALPLIAIFSIFIALKTPIGLFTGPITFKLLVEQKFLSFTPITLFGIILAIYTFFTPLWVSIVAVKSGQTRKSPISKSLSTIILYILCLVVVIGILLLMFPNIFNDIDYYINKVLGVYVEYNFYS